MILTEWNTEDAIAFAREEGLEEGRVEGHAEGVLEGKQLIAQNLLAEGSTPEYVQKITGLDIEAVLKLSQSL